ncbi:Glycoside hydrolase [Trema orientale]|uniref:Glycoside hydrolase n=1 Tax=Trema orientale TaxID=63057 RepID=A0A2P5F4H7_TREOI|nr:Glycoside hydrolase [Trema orientale]
MVIQPNFDDVLIDDRCGICGFGEGRVPEDGGLDFTRRLSWSQCENTRTYNYDLKKKLAKKKGTPYKPNYVFALFNEKPGPTLGRNFGLANIVKFIFIVFENFFDKL